MCTGRVDLSFVLRAFERGADGVFIGGCHLGECNYTTHGNYYALRMASLAKHILASIGIDPGRLSIEFISGGEGNRFAELMNSFSEEVTELGPLGEKEGLSKDQLAANIAAANRIVPYMKLIERERFKLAYETRAEYETYFGGDEFKALFEEAVGEKLSTSRIIGLLEGGPRTTAEMADMLGMSPSEVAKYIRLSSSHGLVRFDEGLKSYALA